MEMASDVSTSTGSGVLCDVSFSLEVYLREYEGLLNIERFGAIPSNGKAKTTYDARTSFDLIQRLVLCNGVGLTGADAARSCKTTTLDMRTYSLYVVKSNTAMCCN